MWRKTRQFLWPHMGWQRYSVYLRHKLARLPGTSYSIAAGFATGAAMSMTPLMGFHFVLSALLAWLIRGNVLASAIGTMVGNPWTFPFIWLSSYKIGCWLLDIPPETGAFTGRTVAHIMENPWATLSPVLMPMLAGSIPMVIVMFILAYWPVFAVVDRYRQRRRDRRHRRMQAMMERMARMGGGLDVKGDSDEK